MSNPYARIFREPGAKGFSAAAFLGRLPVYPPIRVGGDRGVPLVIAEPQSPAGRGIFQLAERVAMRAAVAAHENAIKHKGKIPLIQVR